MNPTAYHQKIIDYYTQTENAYKDSWDLDNSLAIHYGYWDEKVKTFPQSLLRMNEVMMDMAAIQANDNVLDAGCGVGGSSIYIARKTGCHVTGITLSERQVSQARDNAKRNNVASQVDFQVGNYSATTFQDASFDVIWGCESICYADKKDDFIKEAFRLLKPGGRLVVADGFVSDFANNDNPIIRNWLDGWQVNYLETPDRFLSYMDETGFVHLNYSDISRQTSHSVKRLNRFYYLASLYLIWKKLILSKPPSDFQKKNIKACKYQYKGMKSGLWQYGIITGKKP